MKIDCEKLESSIRNWHAGALDDNGLAGELLASCQIIAAERPTFARTDLGLDGTPDTLRARVGVLADYHARNCLAWNHAEATSDSSAKAHIRDAVLETNGGYAAVEMLQELARRGREKTADGLPPEADFTVGEPLWVKRLELKVDRIIRKLGA